MASFRLTFWQGLFIVLFFATLLPYFSMVPIIDEPQHIYESLLAADGKLIYRDFFEFTGPVSFWIMALVIKLTGGVSLIALRCGVLACILLSCWLTVQLLKPFLNVPWLATGFMLIGLFIFSEGLFQVSHHHFSTFFALTAITALARKQDAPSIFTSGLFCGLSLLATQTTGLCITLALAIWQFFFSGKQKLLPLLGGITLPVLLTLTFFGINGSLQDFISHTIFWPLQGGYGQTTSSLYLEDAFQRLFAAYSRFSTQGMPVPVILEGLTLTGSTFRLFLLASLPLVGIAGTAWILLKQAHPVADEKKPLLWLVLLTGTALFLSSLHNFNSFLHATHCWLVLFLGLFVLQHELSQEAQRHIHKILPVLLCIMLVVPYGILSLVTWQTPRVVSYGTKEHHLFAHISMPAPVESVNFITDAIHKNSEVSETVFFYNRSAMFYLLTNRKNPTHFQFLIRRCNPETDIQTTMAQLSKNPPRFIVYDHHDQVFFSTDYRVRKQNRQDYRLTELEQWVSQHYRLVNETTPYLLFEHR